MQHEISFSFFWKCLKKCWLIMIILGIVVALIAGIFANFLPKKYSSSVDFYVVNTNTSYDYTTSALLAASSYLINDYIELIRSNAILDKIASNLNEGKPESEHVTAKQLRGMISASSSDTSIFTIRVTSTDRYFAYEVAKAIEAIAPREVTAIAKPDRVTNENIYAALLQAINENLPEGQEPMELEELKENYPIPGLNSTLDCFKSVNTPVVDTVPDSPDVERTSLVAGGATAVLVYIIFLIKKFFEMKISSEDDVKAFIKRPLVGTIPHWETSSKK